MQKHQDILQQVGRMALATAGCSAIMLVIYAVVGRFTTAVLLGGLLGTVIAVGNFLALSITVSNALDRAAAGDNSVKAFKVPALCARQFWQSFMFCCSMPKFVIRWQHCCRCCLHRLPLS